MRAVTAVLSALLVSACTTTFGNLDEPCFPDGGCTKLYGCVSGFCLGAGLPTGSPCVLEGAVADVPNDGPCATGICVPLAQPGGATGGFLDSVVHGVCTNPCRDDGDCFPGWSCTDQPEGRTCTCGWSPEICDGKDNDCDGVIDNGGGPQIECLQSGSGLLCEAMTGSCVCESQACGGCVDTSVDPMNCGSCGTVCPSGQTCAGGSCVTFDTVVSGLTGPMFFAADELNVYWADSSESGITWKRPLEGGEASTLAAITGPIAVPLAMISDGTSVFTSWTRGGPESGGVGQAGITSGRSEGLASGQSPSFGIAVDADNVYFTSGFDGGPLLGGWLSDGDIISVPKNGTGSLTILARGQAEPWGITVDDANVYWANFGDGTIMSVPKAGGAPVMLASVQDAPTAIAVAAGNLYWANAGSRLQDGTFGESQVLGFIAPGSGSIVQLPLNGGTPTTLTSAENLPMWGIAVDASNVYWVDSAGPLDHLLTGALVKVPLAGGAPVTLATNQNHPWGLVLSGGSLVWSVGDSPYAGFGGYTDGAILRMSIP